MSHRKLSGIGTEFNIKNYPVCNWRGRGIVGLIISSSPLMEFHGELSPFKKDDINHRFPFNGMKLRYTKVY